MEFLNFEGLAYFKNKENSQIAPVESTTTASQAYEIGQYFWYDGKLYEATADIALGDTFVTSGDSANCELADIADDISDARGRISTLEGQVTGLETNKANIDGYYSEMTVGNAEQIVSTVGVEDKTPYNFRTAGGSVDIGDREEDTVVGGTVAWNQLVTTDTNVSKTKSGDIITVTDAVAGNAEDLVVSFEPQQDLHGQDAPYPAGGGKQLFDIDNPLFTAYSQSNYDNYMPKVENGRLYNGGVVGAAAGAGITIPAIEGETYTISFVRGGETASGEVRAVTIGDDNIWLTNISLGAIPQSAQSHTVTMPTGYTHLFIAFYSATKYGSWETDIMIEKGSTASPWKPYANICPITGWTGCEVNRTGKNVFQSPYDVQKPSGYTGDWEGVSVVDGWVVQTGNPIGSGGHGGVVAHNIKAGVYALSFKCDYSGLVGTSTMAYNVWAEYFDGTKATIVSPQYSITAEIVQKVITLEKDVKDLALRATSGGSNNSSVFRYTNIQLELGSTATSYEPYSGTSYSVSWQTEAGTVYGGTWNPLTGKLKQRYTKITISSFAGAFGATANGYAVYISPNNVIRHSKSKCNLFKWNDNGYTTMPVFTFGGSSGVNSTHTFILPSTITSLEEANAWLSSLDEPLEAVLYLETPVEYTLTAQQIALLAGTNNVWNSIGSTQMTYLGTLNEITAQNGHKYLTRVNGSSTVVNGSGQTLSGEKGRDNIFDLTQMFGSTIADYVYSLENTSAGEGVSWFTDLFPKPYYSYNAGQLMSVNTSAHKTVGFNAWDEQWETGYINTSGTRTNPASPTSICSKNHIPVVPNSTYFYSYKFASASTYAYVAFYDKDKTFISRPQMNVLAGNGFTFITPGNCYYIKINSTSNYGATYKHDICINLSWDGERDGEYEAYEEHTYALDESLTLRGIPKLDSGNKLYYDGDVYEDDGTVTRKYRIIDLGSYNWSAQNDCYYILMSTEYSGVNGPNLICTKYDFSSVSIGNNRPDKTINVANPYFGARTVSIKDTSYETGAALKESLNGVYLVYELATSTTEEADPYTNPQIVSDWGTEEYVDYSVLSNEREVSIPVGHVTVYQNNLRAKLEMAPESPSDGDGDYIVRQTNGENEYVKLIIPNELPEAPTEAGNYILQVTISSGTATYSWVSAT